MQGINNSITRFEKIKALTDRLRFFFFWLYWLYPKSQGFHPIYLLLTFFPQKILRINGSIPWPVHFTSKILFTKNISLGNRSAPGMSPNCYIQARNGITIGSNLRLGPGVGLISSNHDENDYDRHVPTEPIIIGDNVWIGMNAVVLPGVIIGNNVMIGASSVVASNIPSDSIAVGNPCRVIKKKSEYKGKDYTNG